MKHKLLSLLALAGAMFMSVSASAWDEPTKPATPALPEMPSFSGNWATPEDGGTYYIYNVGTGQFLGAGQDWGTRAITTLENFVSIDGEGVTLAANRNYIVPFLISHPDMDLEVDLDASLADKWMIQIQNSDRSDVYLCHEGNAAWVDGGMSRRNTDNNGFWTIAAAGDAYELIPLDGKEGNTIVYGVHLTNLAKVFSAYTWTDLQNNETAAAKWKFVSADDAADIEAYVAEVAANAEQYTTAYNDYKARLTAYNEAMTLYNARVAFYNTLLDADKYGVDATAAGAVYNNADATLAEINEANETLKAAIAPAAIEYGCKNSSEENPFEVTNYVMTNADFSASCNNGQTPPGWTIKYTGSDPNGRIGQNVGQQNRTDTNSETGQAITNFLEVWTPQPGTLGNGFAGQWVKGLPAGRYRLTMDATACQQSGLLANEELTGIYLFAGTGTYNIFDEENPVQTGEMRVTTFEWDFDFNADSLIVGLLINETNCNWISADNFHLYAIGAMKEDPVRIGLQNTIAEAEKVEENMPVNNIEDSQIYNVNSDVRSNFETALSEAQAALSGTSDEMKAAVDNLTAAIEAVKKSAETYSSYQTAYKQAMDMAQKLEDNNQWPDLMNDLYDFAEEMEEDFNEGNLTEEGLEEALGKTDALIEAFLNDPDMINTGDDLTILIKNADFSQGSGRDLTGDAVPGWTIVDGQLTELSAAYHNIERYCGKINIQQTIKNLPKGTYRIGVQGFVRIESGENDMVLYAGISEKQFMLITDESSEEPLLGDGSGAWPADSPNTILGGYMPNSMQGANEYFMRENPATGKPFYLNEVEITHTGGDLTIGVKCSATGLWILWDNFTLTFVSRDALSGILAEINTQYDKLQEQLANTMNFTAKTNDAIDAISNKVADAGSIKTEDEAIALLNELKALQEQLKTDAAKVQELMNLCDEYLAKITDGGLYVDESYQALLDQANEEAISNAIESVEKAEEYIQQIKAGWVPAIMANAQPGDDVTAILTNPDFETLNANGWTIKADADDDQVGQNQGYQGATYTNDEDGLMIEHFLEAWRPNANLHDGTIFQEIPTALPQGTYELGVIGYAINQSSNGGINADGNKGVYLFAQLGETMFTTPICVDSENAKPTQWSVTFGSDGKSLTKVGVLVKDANCNWTAFDNFTLTYVSSELPTAVENVNVETTATPSAIFSLDGRQLTRLQRGVNIVRINGSVRKVLVK